MFKTLINALKNKEIRNKLLVTFALLFAYRLGCWIPIPGINTTVALNITDQTIFGLLSAIGGRALQNGALLAIGISPYINASIIVQLLTVAIPKLEQWSKQGEDGKKKIEKITRWVGLILAIAQAVGIALTWYNMTNSAGETALKPIFASESTMWVAIIVGAVATAGAMFTMWLGERITEIGIGNGMSLLIFVGIVASAGLAIEENIVSIFSTSGAEQSMAVWKLMAFLALVVFIFGFIVWIDKAERKIPVQYAKQIKGNKMYGGQSTHIPIKVNANGVLPIIFATAIITFPQIIFQLVSSNHQPVEGQAWHWSWKAYDWWQRWLGAGQPLYFVLMGLLILFFSYFYAQIQFNPDEVARNLQQYGGTLIGIRPGKPTSEYLSKVSKRLTLFGAIFLMVIAVVPSIIFSLVFDQTTNTGLGSAFSATGMLIVVSVALELRQQLESQMMMKHYKGFLK